jgi:type II secretory pathway component PulM
MQPTRREKTVIVAGVGVLAVLAVLQFVVHPTLERISMLRRVIGDKREILAELRAKSLEYKKLDAEVNRLRALIGQQEEGRKILSSIERIRQACGLSENILSLKPTTTVIDTQYQETVVEVRLEGLKYAQLVTFLSQLDSLNLAGGIKTLEVQHADRSPGLLKAVIQLSTIVHVGRQ